MKNHYKFLIAFVVAVLVTTAVCEIICGVSSAEKQQIDRTQQDAELFIDHSEIKP